MKQEVPFNPSLARVLVPCRPFGSPAVLVLVVPRDARSLLAALWHWPGGAYCDAAIGRA